MEKTFQQYQKFIAPLKDDKFNLTEKELKLTQTADINFDYFYEETGYDNCDGDSALLCFTLEEAEKTGFTKHQIAGLISSLDEKGVLYIEYRHPDGTEGPDLYYLSEDFINFIAKANIINGTGRYVFARQEAK
tara:strand:- start:469 stop:867 length:399 start_codon:yes stop_codon:yes gene_type:complete